MKNYQKKTFGCETDAASELKKWVKNHPFILVSNEEITSTIKYEKSGRPKKGEEGVLVFSMSGNLSCLIDYREKEKQKKKVFYLGDK